MSATEHPLSAWVLGSPVQDPPSAICAELVVVQESPCKCWLKTSAS